MTQTNIGVEITWRVFFYIFLCVVETVESHYYSVDNLFLASKCDTFTFTSARARFLNIADVFANRVAKILKFIFDYIITDIRFGFNLNVNLNHRL